MTNIKPWYQQTEIGIIPEDWEMRELWSFLKLQGWYSFSSKIFAKIWIPVIRISDINWLIVNLNECVKIKDITIGKQFFVKKNDILIAMSGATTGKIWKKIDDSPAYINQRVGKFDIFDKEKCQQNFLYQNILSENFQDQLNQSLTQWAQPNISGKQIEKIKITLPKNPTEQSAIAEILSDVDDLITNLDKKIAKRKNIKSATMEQLLTGKIRLAGFDDEWEEKELGEIAIFLKWKWLAKKDIQKNWKYKCIHYWELFTHYKEIISDIKSYTNIYNNPTLSENNDILFPTSDVTPKWLAKASCIQENGIVLWWDILVVRPIWNQLNGKFFAYFVSHNPEKILIFATGTTVFHLYAKDLKNLKIPLPKNPTEQSAIAEILSDMDREISDLEAKKQKYQKIKSALMEQLLTGKIRISA